VFEHAVILLVEDLEEDILLVRRAFAGASFDNLLHVVRDGEEAIDYLEGHGHYSNREEYPLPQLILLDLKMPKIDGFDVLAWLRQQPGLRAIPVVVLTSYNHSRDVDRAYALGASSFLIKPLDFQQHTHHTKLLHDFWMMTPKIPQIFRPVLVDPGPNPQQGP
jgi:CheY-like chemotaxis protein